MSGSLQWPGPNTPNIANQVMPAVAFNGQVASLGWRFGWMRAHTCPCAYSNGTPGSPNPNCLTCFGRGVYWDVPPADFSGLLTFMHTAASPDEPGNVTNEIFGQVFQGEPVLTIPSDGAHNETLVWNYASTFDAFVEYDARTRYNTTLVVSDAPSAQVLPYQWGVEILSVSAYNLSQQVTQPVPPTAWTYSNGVMALSQDYPEGTAYTVEYFASPVWIAFRKAGGLPHARPLAANSAGTPKRFHVANLDQWLRARGGGETPAFGQIPQQTRYGQ